MGSSTNRMDKTKLYGASRDNLWKARIECIIRSETREWIIKRAKPLGISSNNIGELEALKEGLQLSLKNEIKRIIIEGDSQIIINAIRKHQTLNWVMNSKLEYVLSLIDQFKETRFQHIYREGNNEADKLANKGANGEDFSLQSSL